MTLQTGAAVRRTLAVALALTATACTSAGDDGALGARQQADLGAVPEVATPEWSRGEGPRVAIDSTHENFHTADGRYAPFAELLRRDGFRVESFDRPTTREGLADVDVLVIANALAPGNPESLPTPSAFTPDEIATLVEWVEAGGSLLLIADHMPIAGAAYELGRAFGVHFTNGYTWGFEGERDGKPEIFRRDGDHDRLLDHAITRGRSPEERVDRVTTFTGNGFQLDPSPLGESLEPILRFGPLATTSMTQTWGEFREDTPRVPSPGWIQGAVGRRGDGRVALFGEAAMFTAQTSGERAMGFAHEDAPENVRFVLNLLHWLAGRLEG